MKFSVIHLALSLLASALPSSAHGFVVRPTTSLVASVQGGGGSSSATGGSSSTTELGVFNFLNEGKKKLVKSLAGDYDQEAVQARIDGLIQSNPVLMFSFTT